MVNNMDTKQLKTFITVARLNSFTKAANKLGYAQSSITAHIKLLERELGTHLFERIGKNITLTYEGEEMLLHAEKLLNIWENAKNSLSFSEIPKGALIIGVTESVCAVKLPKLLKEYNKLYPDVEITLKIATSHELKCLLRENEIDVAILLDIKIDSTEFDVKFQQSEQAALFVAPTHPLASKYNVSARDLSEHSMILTQQGCICRNIFEKTLKEENITSKLILDTSNVQTIKQLVMFGFGVAFLPRFAVVEELKNNNLIELSWDAVEVNIMIQVVCHKDKWISSALKEFSTLIQINEF